MYLHRSRIMIPWNPPLIAHLQILLKIEEQIRRRHSAAGEEVRCHPTFFEVIRRISVAQYLNEKFAICLQRPRNLGEEKLVIL